MIWDNNDGIDSCVGWPTSEFCGLNLSARTYDSHFGGYGLWLQECAKCLEEQLSYWPLPVSRVHDIFWSEDTEGCSFPPELLSCALKIPTTREVGLLL